MIRICLKVLIEPFIYPFTVIPIVPKSYVNVLDSPMPFILGSVVDFEEDCRGKAVYCDIDTGKIKESEVKPPFFGNAVNLIQELAENNGNIGEVRQKWEFTLKKYILSKMNLLKGKEVEFCKAELVKKTEIEDIEFVDKFVDTQIFAEFIAEYN